MSHQTRTPLSTLSYSNILLKASAYRMRDAQHHWFLRPDPSKDIGLLPIRVARFTTLSLASPVVEDQRL